MNIKQKVCMLSLLTVMITTTHVFAEGTFLCMRSNENTAITIDGGGNYKYIDMTSSNGSNVYPQLSTDGNTYLPLRYICEKAGLKDGSKINGELPEGYFRYSVSEDTNKPVIEIKYNNINYCHNVGEEFSYTASEGDVRNVAIYNIDGSLYVPMAYIAKITNAKAVWQRDTGQIMFISNSLDAADYIAPDNRLIRSKEIRLESNYYNNNLGESSLYLKTDGRTVSDLSLENGVKAGARSVTRSGNVIYYINKDSRVMTKTENAEDETEHIFTDKTGKVIDVYASTVIVLQNKLYGIKCDDKNMREGRLFCSELDGTGFEYLTEMPVYNLILKNNQSNYSLFYCEAEQPVIHMISVKTKSDYTVEITDHERVNMLRNIKQFAVGNDNLFYLDSDGLIHIIDTKFRIEDIEIQMLDSDSDKIFQNAENGDDIRNIDAMNYDYVNNILYIQKGGCVYYYTPESGTFRVLYSETEDIKQFSLMMDISYYSSIAGVAGNKVFVHRISYSGGNVGLDRSGE